jgi:hypothetical protein
MRERAGALVSQTKTASGGRPSSWPQPGAAAVARCGALSEGLPPSRRPAWHTPRGRQASFIESWATRPIAHTRALCITVSAMSDTEAHQYRLGSPLASIVGIAEATLERDDLDDDVATRVRAIRDLALDALRKAERGDPESGQAGPQA